mmetsp:Transcript_220/g.268  ORF Transcript_220/g.268 Transcript_220/m.268 type:complete len:652 (+) Transcript_220:1-1956(+)
MEVSIIRVEGLQEDLNSTGCYVSVDSKLYDVITPLSSDNPDAAVELPCKGELRLIIKNMSQESYVIGSVSVSLELLPESGFCWLPLFETLNKDQVFDFEQEFQPPRVLISVNEAGGFQLPKIEELSSNPITPVEGVKMSVQHSRTGSIDEHWITRVTELEQRLDEERWKYHQELADLKESMISNDQCAAKAVNKLEQECIEKDVEIGKLKSQIQLLSNGKDQAKGFEAKEAKYNAEIEERDVEIGKLREVLNELQSKQAEILSREVGLSNFSKDEFQQTVDDLITQNKELQSLYELADNDRMQMEDQLKDMTSQLELEVAECINLERHNCELKEQVKHLTEELKQKRVRSREPSVDRLIECKRPESAKKDERAKLKLKIDELKDCVKELTSQNEVLADELDYAQSSLKEQNLKVERLSKENEALNAFKFEVEKSSELKDVTVADAEFKEFICRRGLERVILRKAEGEFLILDYTMKPYKKNGGLVLETHGGMQLVEELIKLALKGESTRSKQNLMSTMPARRTSASTGLTNRANIHRRTNTELLDLSLSEKSKATDISYSSQKEDLAHKPPKVRKISSRPATSRKENENIQGNRIEPERDHTPSKTLFKATVASLSKNRTPTPASTTPVRERVQKRISRPSERQVQRVPFK